MTKTAKPRRIIFIGFEGLQLLDLVGPADVFSIASIRIKNSYQCLYVGTKSQVSASNGMPFQLEKLPAVNSSDTIVVPGGMSHSVMSALTDDTLMAWLKSASSKAHRVASVCSGSFILAHLGLLDNKKAVTHWVALDHLAKKAPKAKIQREAIYVEDGKIWTSAGVTTGIDLALAMVRKDLGNHVALRIAQDLVVQVIRPGNQSQYSAPLSLQRYANESLEKLLPWLESRMSSPTTVAEMADKMGLSERQFHRQCVAQFGRTPAKILLEIKLNHARNLLQDKDIPITNIGNMCGFSGSAAFSKAFKKQFSISPAMFRKHWAMQEDIKLNNNAI